MERSVSVCEYHQESEVQARDRIADDVTSRLDDVARSKIEQGLGGRRSAAGSKDTIGGHPWKLLSVYFPIPIPLDSQARRYPIPNWRTRMPDKPLIFAVAPASTFAFETLDLGEPVDAVGRGATGLILVIDT